MKTKIALLSLATTLCITGMSYAMLPDEEAFLGGIRTGYSYEQVTAIYGEPTEKTEPKKTPAYGGSYTMLIKYGDTLSFFFEGRNEAGPFHVIMISVSGNNGFATPKGIHVKSPERDIYRAYGRPDFDIPSRGSHYIMYKTSKYGKMSFHFKDGLVSNINLGYDA